MTTNDFIQRRKHVRVDAQIPLILNWPGSNTPEETTTINISGGGVRCMTCNKMITNGTNIKVLITLPGYFESQQINGKVVFIQLIENNDDKTIIGIQFEQVLPKIEQAIVRFCFQTELLNRQDKPPWVF